MIIPFIDLKREHQEIKQEIAAIIEEVVNNARFVLGNQVNKFEQNFAKFCQSSFCCGVGNGTQAIELALKALGIKAGDEVITVCNTSPFTIIGILHSGAKVVLVDCGEDHLIDANKIEHAITDKTKAIVPVHLYGKMCDMEAIKAITKQHNLLVIEDACQAHGARYKGKLAGAYGDAGCFSFYETKNLGAYGDAGCIITNNQELDKKIRVLRAGGMAKRDHIEISPGINSRMDELQAGILNVKLEKLEQWNKKRQINAEKYNELLNGVNEISCPEFDPQAVYHLYVVRAKKRNELKEFLNSKGVVSLIHYPIPNHLQQGFNFLGYKQGDFAVSERLSKEVISLPIFPQIKEEEIKHVCSLIKEFYNG